MTADIKVAASAHKIVNDIARRIVIGHALTATEETMAEVRINALKNGPLEVAGEAKLFDHQGKEYQEDQFPPVYLCRCGSSKNKPFCDGSHEAIGFKAEETAN